MVVIFQGQDWGVHWLHAMFLPCLRQLSHWLIPACPQQYPQHHSNDGGNQNKLSPAGHIMLEKDKTKGMIEQHIGCPLYKSSANVSFSTACIASACRIESNNKMSSYATIRCLCATVCRWWQCFDSTKKHATNFLFVLGFMTSSDGGKKAEGILDCLGLPNYTTLEKWSFTTIEDMTSGPMQELGNGAIFENLSVSGPVVRPTDETHTCCDMNGYLRITHDRGRCNGIEMISRDSLNKSSLFRYFIL